MNWRREEIVEKEWTLWTSVEPEYSWWRGEFTALVPVRTREEAEAQTEEEAGDGIDTDHVYRIVVQKVKRTRK